VKVKPGRSIPRGVWVLGLVSLCMDLSSEMIHSLLPVYLVTVLGAGTVWLGLIEGIAEGTASITKVFSGVLSDRIGRRKPLVVVGYGLAAVVKPAFPLAPTAAWILAARFVDRVGKGIRGAPRDALVADITPPEVRGAAYGLRQTLDTAGAILGPLVALVLLTTVSDDMRTVFWIATLPAIAAVLVLVLFVHEPPNQPVVAGSKTGGNERRPPSAPIPRQRVHQFGGSYWYIVVLAGLIGISRFSEAFLVLRASESGLPILWTPAALAIMNVAYAASAYPLGKLSDRFNRTVILAGGLAVLAVSHLLLAMGANLGMVLLGILMWGLHMGLTQGLLSAMVADAAPVEHRGSAFGIFHLVSGASLLCGSLLAGIIWHWQGSRMTFLFGAACSAITLASLVRHRGRSDRIDPGE
jgi:MFS family permease